ncbi:MAG: helix-turn-helix domain-containing protein [bacterium]|nr:helix-turn-helix domain-containing protein [bacterium]
MQIESKTRGRPLPTEFLIPGPARIARVRRTELGLSRNAFARELGVTPSRLTQAESGYYPYSLDSLPEIARILNIPLDELCPPVPPISNVVFDARIDLDQERDTVERAAGLREGTLTLIENGYVSNPDMETRIALSSTLGIQISEWTTELYRAHVLREKNTS